MEDEIERQLKNQNRIRILRNINQVVSLLSILASIIAIMLAL